MQRHLIDRKDVDVVIAGGAIAGAAAAAALSQLGLRILIVEPDPDQGRRLAGELIHPPGIEGLRELGLLDDEPELGAPVKGFAIYSGVSRGDPAPMVLPYGETKCAGVCGRAIEHQVLRERLLEKARRLQGVEVWLGARVTRMEGDSGNPFSALVKHEGRNWRVNARLILGADGPMSQTRKLAGIAHRTQRYSGMMGAEVDAAHLPYVGYGNIFLNPAGVAYAYGIGNGRARVMFEVLRDADPEDSIRSHLSYFPPAFRVGVERAMATGRPLAAANYCIIPERSVERNFALIGDARGCCHPLTASGITAAVKDALVLRDALRESRHDIRTALRHYARVCGRLELTRRTLAEELREAFLAKTPEDLLLHQCIFSYWRNSPRGRVRSMELLSSRDSSSFSLAAQYVMVVLHAFHLLPHRHGPRALVGWSQGMLKLLRKSVSFQRTALNLWFKELCAGFVGASGF